ncbi:hypothetical protein B0H65DRAFT_321902 [Neurospora tetraspora]|uniref:Uncharacterized protein n=1 Tax=Neurospora tetraspora TaxID=94610 RepID=A0AAE0MPA0_9PEZI|nr:hypothetical protein B0H65DRAFT_321902 [Neurospora tetraspora]
MLSHGFRSRVGHCVLASFPLPVARCPSPLLLLLMLTFFFYLTGQRELFSSCSSRSSQDYQHCLSYSCQISEYDASILYGTAGSQPVLLPVTPLSVSIPSFKTLITWGIVCCKSALSCCCKANHPPPPKQKGSQSWSDQGLQTTSPPVGKTGSRNGHAVLDWSTRHWAAASCRPLLPKGPSGPAFEPRQFQRTDLRLECIGSGMDWPFCLPINTLLLDPSGPFCCCTESSLLAPLFTSHPSQLLLLLLLLPFISRVFPHPRSPSHPAHCVVALLWCFPSGTLLTYIHTTYIHIHPPADPPACSLLPACAACLLLVD